MTIHPIYHFVPREIILHLEHDNPNDATLEANVDAFLSGPIVQWNMLKREINRTITFPFITGFFGPKISMIVTTIPDPDPGVLINVIKDLYDLINPAHLPVLPAYSLGNGISLVSITPNWLSSVTPHQPGTGGPGARPVPAPKPIGSVKNYPFRGIGSIADYINDNAGSNVEVAILDTAPWTTSYMFTENDQGMIEKPTQADWNDHIFLKDLLGSNLSGISNILNFVPYKHVWKDFCFSLRGHSYLMPDHGLFIAGIIHTIAPKAHISLYEVLNPYGSGSYESFYNGLERLLLWRQKNPDKKLVINLSLVLDMPLVDNDLQFINTIPGLTRRNHQNKLYFALMVFSVQSILEKITSLNNVVVAAAAGNKSSISSRKPACYPAAHPKVIGVGALPKGNPMSGNHYQPASYSNYSDQPYSDGFMIMGGRGGAGKGIKGVYIHKFPIRTGLNSYTYNGNTTGWAWWAGTSFATAIMSGLLASAMSSNPIIISYVTAHHFMSALAGNSATGAREKVFLVEQP